MGNIEKIEETPHERRRGWLKNRNPQETCRRFRAVGRRTGVERLVSAGDKVDTVKMESRTATQRKLQPTRENGEESRKKECDYILLTQIVDPRAHPLEPRLPEISIGGRVPSVDASDSRPVSRENLQISFALFLTGRFKPVLDTLLYDRPSTNVSDTLEMAMDREANNVSDELKKKHVRPPE